MVRLAALFLLLLFSMCLHAREDHPVAEKGILDLRGIADSEHFILKLNGEWEFYWKQLLYPHDFKKTGVVPDHYSIVPSYWTDYHELADVGKFGYATYRLRVLFPEGFRTALGIDLPVFDSSYDVYINDKYVGGAGITGRSMEDSKPEYQRVFARIQPADTLEIVINVSNYHHRRGGFWLPVKLGTFTETQKRLAGTWALEWSATSFLLGFSLLFLFFYIASPSEKLMVFFSMVALGLASRPFFTNHLLINNIVDLPWQWIVKAEYMGLFFTIVAMSWYSYYLYRSRYAKITARIVTVLFCVAYLLVLVTPVTVFSYTILLFYPAVLLVLSYLLARSIGGALKMNKVDFIYVAVFLLVIIGSLNDIFISLGKSSSGRGYILSYIVVLVVFIQATLLLYKWIKAFHEKERLRHEMEFMNRNLELLVNERTQELIKINEEIEQQNSRIARQNKELSDTIQLKNRIFSVIAHDLRSPVVNILYMLNLLKEKEFKEKYDTFANSSIDYAQRVIGLLENMLVWGRGQEEKIKVSPANHDLADIILTNLSIFKETADNKEISVNFTQVGSPVAYCDRDLLDIIIRNLFSNAVKYTPRKGRISIFLKDRKNTGEGIMLKICDNGTGMSEEKQQTIFTSAEVESTPGTENEKGTGLGLKLCCELVRLNNGSIFVESRINEGTCFIITLPA